MFEIVKFYEALAHLSVLKVPIEVEVKYQVNDLKEIEYHLMGWNAKLVEMVIQRDHYFNHPARDFAQTDEAFRIREEGTEVLLTYKGPKFDKKSKTRKEIEIKIPNTEQMFELLDSLGFRKVHVVSKERKIYVLNDIHWSLDLVDSLGSFIELEKIVSTKDEVDSALIAIFEAVESLGLKPKDTIRKSYMELLLEKK